MNKMIVVYYSWSNGNTEKIAKQLQAATASEIARIEMVKPYSGSYEDVVEQGKEEVDRGFKPEIKPTAVDLKNYDIIAVGTPTWWYTMAPAVASFLDNKDWNGKIVVPFITNGGWPGHVIDDIKIACQGAEFAQEMEVRFDSSGGNHMETGDAEVGAWITRVRNILLG